MKEEFWPRLLKEDKKVHFLKTDFDKVSFLFFIFFFFLGEGFWWGYVAVARIWSYSTLRIGKAELANPTIFFI